MKPYKLEKQDMYKKPISVWKVALIILIIIALVFVALILISDYKDKNPSKTEIAEQVEDNPTDQELIQPLPDEPVTNTLPEDLEAELFVGDYPVRAEYPYALKETKKAVDDSYFDDAIFIGDSITTGIFYYMIDTYPDIDVVAEKGVSIHDILTNPKIRTADGMKTVLDAAKAMGEKNKVYVLLGGNDQGNDKEMFKNDYITFIKALKQQYPKADIYIQSITPVTETPEQKQNYPRSNNKDINGYNTLIMEAAEETGVYYLDIAVAVMDDQGRLPAEASPDGVHFVAEYYYKWFDYLKKHTRGEKQ